MSAAACAHCGQPVDGAAEKGEAALYCCLGCATAAEIIRSSGLEQYYSKREATPDRPGPPSAGWDQVAVQTLPDGLCRARLAIDGLHCASCVWVTEGVLGATPGVRRASVSYASGRADVVWDPATVDLGAIVRRVTAIGYRPRPLHEAARPDHELLTRLGVAAFAAGNAMMFAVPLYLGWWEGIDERYAALFRWALLVLATPVALWAAVPFYRGALAGLRTRIPHVDLPVSVGVIVLYAHGLWSTLHGAEAYLDSLTMLVALLLAGRVLDQGRRRRAMEAAGALASSAPRVARLHSSDGPVEVRPEALCVGDLIEVAAGEEIAADGEVAWGRGFVRMALLTGESEPVSVAPGDRVVAGALLADGSIQVRVESLAADSLLSAMAEQLRASADRPGAPTVADRLAPGFTLLTLGLAALTWLGHAARGGFDPAAVHSAWAATVAVLVVACPCALALAAPLSSAAGLGAAARRGLLLRSGDALRRLATVDLVVLDKTGTVTGGVPEVIDADDEVLRLAAGLERNSAHPVARAIVAAARARALPIPLGELVREERGLGLVGDVHGARYIVAGSGPGLIGLWRGERAEGAPIGQIRLADRARPDAARVIEGLNRLGLSVVLLTGDSVEVAARVAGETGLHEVVAGARPQEKAAWIAARRAEGRRVLFVGDGLNDGPALAAADVGVAMGGGAASSVIVADGVITAPALGPILAGVVAARAAAQNVRLSLIWSLSYNAVAVALAAVGLVNPLVAAVLMPLSSGIVVARASRVEPRTAAGLAAPKPTPLALTAPPLMGA